MTRRHPAPSLPQRRSRRRPQSASGLRPRPEQADPLLAGRPQLQPHRRPVHDPRRPVAGLRDDRGWRSGAVGKIIGTNPAWGNAAKFLMTAIRINAENPLGHKPST